MQSKSGSGCIVNDVTYNGDLFGRAAGHNVSNMCDIPEHHYWDIGHSQHIFVNAYIWQAKINIINVKCKYIFYNIISSCITWNFLL
jgi:hypothetical protein